MASTVAGDASGIESAWLDYAWAVANCPASHLAVCQREGAAPAVPGRDSGNGMRFPGYLGAAYQSGRALCLGSAWGEPPPEESDPDKTRVALDRTIDEIQRDWVREGRSAASDSTYLRGARSAYSEAIQTWPQWRRYFRSIVEDYVGLDVTQIAWSNFAKCRTPAPGGGIALARACQGQFPIADLIEAIHPVVVFTAVLAAGRPWEVVRTWGSLDPPPLVYAFHGLRGTDDAGRKLRDWAAEAGRAVAGRRHGS